MNKKTVLFLLILSLPFLIFGQEVAEGELLSYGSREIEYINYTGPHPFINTAEEITGIGRELWTGRRRSTAADFFSAKPGKYSLQRFTPPREGGIFGADLLVLDSGAQVDHIDNVRRIISGYLMESFGYSFAESLEVAALITRYNTYLRGRIDYFTGRYSGDVLKNLKSESLGLSRNYMEWPGTSTIVIPLEFGGSAVTTSPETQIRTDISPGRPATGETAPGTAQTTERTGQDQEQRISSDRPPATAESQGGPAGKTNGTLPSGEALPESGGDISPVTGSDRQADSETSRDGTREAETGPRVAVEEISKPEEELTALPDKPAVKTQKPFPWIYVYLTLGILVLALLLLLLISRIKRKQERYGSSAYLSAGSGGRSVLGEKNISSLKNPIVMRLVYRNYLLNRKVLGDLPPGGVKTVGGRGSYFSIPYLILPNKIAEVENQSGLFILTPVEPEYFPETRGPLRDFLGKEITVQSKEGEKVIILFHPYVSPLEEINKIMRSVEPPEKKEEL